jgi:hypothetical protein
MWCSRSLSYVTPCFKGCKKAKTRNDSSRADIVDLRQLSVLAPAPVHGTRPAELKLKRLQMLFARQLPLCLTNILSFQVSLQQPSRGPKRH